MPLDLWAKFEVSGLFPGCAFLLGIFGHFWPYFWHLLEIFF